MQTQQNEVLKEVTPELDQQADDDEAGILVYLQMAHEPSSSGFGRIVDA